MRRRRPIAPLSPMPGPSRSQEMRQRIRIESTSPVDRSQAPLNGGGTGGAVDSNGTYQPYGILGVTPLGSFRLKP